MGRCIIKDPLDNFDMNPTMPSMQAYTPNYNNKTAIGKLIDSFGKNLAPTKRFDQVMNYETYAAPQKQAFDYWRDQVYRPEFDRQTLNPFQNRAADMGAATNSWMMGNAPQQYNNDLTNVMQSYYDTVANAQQQYDDMTLRGYQQQILDYYNSPTAMNNIGM